VNLCSRNSTYRRISLFWSCELQGHPEQLNGDDHDWLIQTPVSTVQRGMLVWPDADTCAPGHTVCVQFSAEQAANVVDLERQWWCGRTSAYAVWFKLWCWALCRCWTLAALTRWRTLLQYCWFITGI